MIKFDHTQSLGILLLQLFTLMVLSIIVFPVDQALAVSGALQAVVGLLGSTHTAAGLYHEKRERDFHNKNLKSLNELNQKILDQYLDSARNPEEREAAKKVIEEVRPEPFEPTHVKKKVIYSAYFTIVVNTGVFFMGIYNVINYI